MDENLVPFRRLIMVNRLFMVLIGVILVFAALVGDLVTLFNLGLVFILIYWFTNNIQTFRVMVRTGGLMIYAWIVILGITPFASFTIFGTAIGSVYLFTGIYGQYILLFNSETNTKFVN